MNSPTPSPVTIARCPNPKCGSECIVGSLSLPNTAGGLDTWWQVQCSRLMHLCGYRGPTGVNPEHAISAHNSICRPSAVEDVKASPVVPVSWMEELEAKLRADAELDENQWCGLVLEKCADRIAQLIKEAKGE